MKKPTKAEIEKLAEVLRSTHAAEGKSSVRSAWRRVAKYVLANYTKIETTATIANTIREDVAKVIKKMMEPKSCRLVRGKVVCS